MQAQVMPRLDAEDEFQIRSLLIVDDEIALAEELADAMADHGFRCFVAQDEREALDLFIAHPSIETLIIDFYLRGGGHAFCNGLDLVDRLRAAEPLRTLDCLVVSGDPDVVTECTMNGVTKFLPKPVQPEALSVMLRQPGQPAVMGPENPNHVLQRRLAQQSEAIAMLSKKVSESQDTKTQVSRQIDRLFSAAFILRDVASGKGHPEITDLAQYIVEISAATKRLSPTLTQPKRDLFGARPLK